MSLDDWILALHLLSAAAMVGAIVLFWVVVVVAWRAELPGEVDAASRILPWGNAAIGIGTIGTIVFGVWLAISLDGVKVWDGWVIAAIVMWAIASEVGRRGGVAYQRAVDRAGELVAAGATTPDPELRALVRARPALAMHAASTVLTLLILIDMIWKPGA